MHANGLSMATNENVLISKLNVKPDSAMEFADWQAALNASIAMQPGFVSLEILSPILPHQPEWLLVQRFHTPQAAKDWHRSEIRNDLMEKFINHMTSDKRIIETFSDSGSIEGSVTEVFITQVSPENEKAYRSWMAKIHQAEAKFPGFRGVYMQSPGQTGSLNWVTLLQFDTPANLDRWLGSPERQKVLQEGQALIKSLDTHRMISPYSGWFASVAKEGKLPPLWKQTMLVLLVLFPIIMFEFKFLSPWTSQLNISLGTFIGNAISVVLISWPMMPIAIFFLKWWLSPNEKKHWQSTIKGSLLVIFLYIIEIAVFWNFL